MIVLIAAFFILSRYLAIFFGDTAVFKTLLDTDTTPDTFFRFAPEPPIKPLITPITTERMSSITLDFFF